MQTEPTTSICPLCRTAFDPVPGPTRLCEKCQGIIQAILPQTATPTTAGSATSAASLNRQAALTSEAVTSDGRDSARQEFIEEAQPPVVAPQHFADLTTGPLQEPAVAAQRGVSDSAERGFPGYNQPADPWEAPLPSWEYSRNEYPVLLSPNGREKRNRVWIVAAIILLVAVVAVALSMIFLNPSGGEKTGSNALASGEQQKTALISHGEIAEKSEPAAATQAPAPPSPDGAQMNGEKNTSGPVSSDQNGASQGAVSLQAMSSPNEDEANRYAEKLTRAGIPAYVVAANIEGRGRWFRVRVGRFATAEEAKKHSAEYRQRARAAGINLDFIVSGP